MSAAAWGTVAAGIGTAVAIVVSLVSLHYARRADQRAERDAQRLERAEQRAERAERRERRANLVAQDAGGSYTSGQLAPRQRNFDISNTGPATARRVQLWLTDSAQQRASNDMTNGQLVLRPGEPGQRGSVMQHAPVEGAELEVWASWTDDDGEHEERLDVQLS
jgi:hypothetical protein